MSLWQRVIATLRAIFAARPVIANAPMQVMNRTRGNVLASKVDVAGSGASRRKGLLGRVGLEPGEGLWIVPCESVHTFFMKFPIDLVYLDRKNTVRKLRSEVGPWRVSACFSAHSVLELAPGTIRATKVERGDRVEFVPGAEAESDTLV